MNTFSISANSWNQGLWNSTTHEYSGTGQGITTDKIPIELGNQSLTFVGNGDNKYITVQKCVIRDGVKTFESPVNATIFRLYVRLFDKDDNVLKSFSISQGGTIDVSGALTASKIMISVDASETARSIFIDRESCTNGNYVICEPINLVYTCVHWSFASDEFPRCDDATTDIPDFTTPIPKAQWRVNPQYNNGFVYNELLPDIPRTAGAFQNADKLERVKIPISVKTIGPASFKGTALQRVRIAADCTYEETSFPAGCVVTRYPDDRYDQLYDSAGKAVLDYDARRVYVLKEDTSNG